MSEEEFNQTVKDFPNDSKNVQPDEYNDNYVDQPISEHNLNDFKIDVKPKKKNKISASSFLFLIVGASTTIAGFSLLSTNEDKANIELQEVLAERISFSFNSNIEGLTGRVYNDFESLDCNLVYELQDDEGLFHGFGHCESLKPNTKYTLSLDGETVLGNASKAKVHFTTSAFDYSDELLSISIDGTLAKTHYYTGEVFDPTGLEVSATYSSGLTKNVSELVGWDITPLTLGQDSTIVTFTENGITLTATYTGIEVVNYVPVTGVIVDALNMNLFVDQTSKITAKVAPIDASIKDITFESLNDLIATVDDEGNVTGVSQGTTEIIVTSVDGGITQSVIINVLEDTWQHHTEITTSLELLNLNKIKYVINFGYEVSNISELYFDYYDDSNDTFITRITVLNNNIDPISHDSTFIVDITGIPTKEFYVVIFVNRLGGEEALGYSETYDLKEAYTNIDDFHPYFDISIVDQSNIVYFDLNTNDPYGFYSNLRATLTSPTSQVVNAIIEDDSVTLGFFRITDNPLFERCEYGTVNIYIEFNGTEYLIYSDTIELYSAMTLDSFIYYLEIIAQPLSSNILVAIRGEFYDFKQFYDIYSFSLSTRGGEILLERSLYEVQLLYYFDYSELTIDSAETYDFSVSVIYKGNKTLLKTVEDIQLL